MISIVVVRLEMYPKLRPIKFYITNNLGHHGNEWKTAKLPMIKKKNETRERARYMLLNTEWTLTLRSFHPTRPAWKTRAHDFGAKSLVFIPSSEEIRVTSKDCYIFGHCSIFPRCADRRCPASELEKSKTKKNCCCIEPGNWTRARFRTDFEAMWEAAKLELPNFIVLDADIVASWLTGVKARRKRRELTLSLMRPQQREIRKLRFHRKVTLLMRRTL